MGVFFLINQKCICVYTGYVCVHLLIGFEMFEFYGTVLNVILWIAVLFAWFLWLLVLIN